MKKFINLFFITFATCLGISIPLFCTEFDHTINPALPLIKQVFVGGVMGFIFGIVGVGASEIFIES